MKSHSRQAKQSKSRQFLHLPNKVLFISTFFNQKLKNQLGHTQSHFCQKEQVPLPIKKQKNVSSSVTPKYELNHSKIFLSFEDLPRDKNRYRKVFKHSSLYKDENRMIDETILHRISVDKSKRVDMFKEDHDSFFVNTKKSVLLGQEHQKIIKKQLQDKFQRTRLNFKEKEKEDETFYEMGKDYRRKHSLTRKLNKSEEVGDYMNETERFQPWIRNKLTRNDLYELQESGQNYF